MGSNTKVHSDIKSDDWISLFFPENLRPLIALARLNRPIGIWLLLLPGWWAIALAAGGLFTMNGKDWKLIALFGIGAVVMRSAGCVINDLWDRNLDRKVKRTKNRPLASGAISPRYAIIFMTGLLLCGLMILLQMNITTILLGFLVVPFIVAYPLMKRILWWPQAFLGVTFNFGVLMGWAAVSGIVSLPALALYIGGIFWTLGYDTIYAHQDKEDDLLAGIKSTALKFGDQSKKWVAGFYAASWVLMVLAFVAAGDKWLSLAVLTGAGFHLAWQIQSWDTSNPESSLKIFKANRNFGLIVLAAAMLA